MGTHKEPEDPAALAHSESQGYETRDFALAPIGKVTVGFYIFTVVSFAAAMVAMFLLFRLFSDQTPTAHGVIPPREQLPPPPLLQSDVTAKKDMVDIRVNETQTLGSYGWVDEDAGIARIPIDRAIEVTAAQGLPSTPMGEENRR